MSKKQIVCPQVWQPRGTDQHGQRSQVEESAPQRFLVAFHRLAVGPGQMALPYDPCAGF